MSRPLEESTYAFTVPPLVEAVPAARDRVADRARRLGLSLGEELIHDLKLLTGELVANSVMHTKAACVVCVRWAGVRVRVEVTDADPTSVTPAQALHTDEHGRGLFLVAASATEWGSNPCTAGKITWFELAIPTSTKQAATLPSSQGDVPAERAIVTRAGSAHLAVAEAVPIAGVHPRVEHQAA
jgi:anti-sigma regulatory factor (Ser/Thr protein kinase)